MTPLERADKVREALQEASSFRHAASRTLQDVPPGSLILTPDEAEMVRADFRAALAVGERGLPARALALLAGEGQT